jgi:hypothetical protein
MAENTLNAIFSLEQQIKVKNAELKALQDDIKAITEQHNTMLNSAILSGKTENRYYIVKNKVARKGDREIQIALLKEKYPDVYTKCLIEVVNIKDAQKELSDNAITEISIKHPDKITYWVEKKNQTPIVVA